MKFLRPAFLFITLVYSFTLSSQEFLKGYVLDAATGEPLPFCHVIWESTQNGSITNEDGFFRIENTDAKDRLVISYLGYIPQKVSPAELRQNPRIRLKRNAVILDELVVVADANWIYDAIHQCKKRIRKAPSQTSKTYFLLETQDQERPIEMIECFYNGTTEGASVKKLRLKNGRVGLPLLNDGYYFVNLSTSKALLDFDLIQRNLEFPANPMQFGPSRMKKLFSVQQLPTFGDSNLLHIAFYPREDPGAHFEGEFWIDRKTDDLLKLELRVAGASRYPFYPIGPDSRIEGIDFTIQQTYSQTEAGVVMDHMDFDYKLQFHLRRDNVSRKLNLTTQGLLYFFDKKENFMLPFFDYSDQHADYRMISFLPYDSLFWDQEIGFQLSEKQQAQQEFFKEQGVVINFEEDFGVNPFFEYNNLPWSARERIRFSKKDMNTSGKNIETYRPEFQSQLYDLEVQLFLDVNQYADTFHFTSATILDIFQSFNNLEESDQMDCFANIYFDLCEVHRREMMQELRAKAKDKASIQHIYEKHLANMENTLDSYTDDVFLGKNRSKLRIWNEQIEAMLGIDNMALFNISEYDD